MNIMKKLITLALLWPLWAGAAEYWATQAGAGAHDGTSLADAWAQNEITFGGAGAAGRGDTLYLCGTTAAPISAQVSLVSTGAFDGTVDSMADVMIVSGNAEKCGGTQGVIQTTTGHGLLASGQPAIYMQEMTCLGTESGRNCFVQYLGSTSGCVASEGYYCGYQKALTCVDSGAHCAVIGSSAATNFPATAVTGLRQENITSTNAEGSACQINMHADGPEQINCASNGDAQALDTWGIYQRGITINCGTFLAGNGGSWTQQSGNVYYTTQAACGSSISSVIDVFMPDPATGVSARLALDAACVDASSCGTNVGPGEYGVVSDTIYINIGKAPSVTAAVYLTYAWNSNARITGGYAKDTGSAHDGVGIGCDFGIDGCIIAESYTENTPGPGYSCGGGSKDCEIRTSICNGAGVDGCFSAHGGTTINNVVSAGNAYTVRARVLLGDTITVRNVGGSGLTAAVNVLRNEGTITEVTNSAADPQFAGGPNPTNADGFAIPRSSPLFGAGTAVAGVTTDYAGNDYRNPPSIGAFESYDVYVKCDTGGANGTGSFASPFNTFAGYEVLTGDNIYLWPDVTCTADKAMNATHMIDTGNNRDNVTISLYPGATAQCNKDNGDGCAKLDGGGTLNIGIQARSSDNLLVQDVWSHDYLYHAFRHMGDENADHSVTLRRVRLSEAGPTDDADNTYSILSKGTCGIFLRSAHGPPKTTVYGEDVAVDRCSRLGMDHRWRIEAEYHRFSGSRTGYDRLIGGHGISAHPLSQDWSGAFVGVWTYESGTCPGSDCVYSHEVQTTLDDPQLLQDRTAGPSVKLQRIADGDTTPPEGYFSRVGDLLYTNFGYDPSANAVRVIRQPIHVDVYDGLFWGNMIRDDGNLEGSGFHADDTAPMRCIRCASWDNEGNGFYFNNGVRYWSGKKSACINCVAWNNGDEHCTGTTCGKGIYSSGGEVDIVNSVAFGSLREDLSIAGNFNTCGLLANSAGIGGRWGLRFQHDALTKCAPQSIAVHGNSTAGCEGSGACLSLGDPKFMGGATPDSPEDFRLLPSSPLIRAGTCYLGVGCAHADYEGRRPRVPPDIGPFQRH